MFLCYKLNVSTFVKVEVFVGVQTEANEVLV